MDATSINGNYQLWKFSQSACRRPTNLEDHKLFVGSSSVYDLRFKAWAPTKFLTEFQTLVITPENFVKMRWQKNCENCETDGQIAILRPAWSQLKLYFPDWFCTYNWPFHCCKIKYPNILTNVLVKYRAVTIWSLYGFSVYIFNTKPSGLEVYCTSLDGLAAIWAARC